MQSVSSDQRKAVGGAILGAGAAYLVWKLWSKRDDKKSVSSASASSTTNTSSSTSDDATAKSGRDLVFAINGELRTIKAADVDPRMSLNEYIRRHTPFTGTKLACGEGGCGACVVVLTRWDPASRTEITVSANSCLRPLPAVDGWAITTTEGLRPEGGFHPVQERLAGFNGSQCGYCTPGMVMGIYACLKKGGSSGRSMEELEGALDGNICRCTGYRPILDAAKSFASDTNVQDHVCKTQKVGPYDTALDPQFPGDLKPHQRHALKFEGNGVTWVRPSSLEEALDLLQTAVAPRLVVAHTSMGIYKNDTYKTLIDVQSIPELLGVRETADGLTVGASATISQLIDGLRGAVDKYSGGAGAHKVAGFDRLIAHAMRIASYHVRDVGCVAGNLSMAKTKGFTSDLATLMLGIDAKVSLLSKRGTRVVSMEEFLSSPRYSDGEMMSALHVPFLASNEAFYSYKVALRQQNAHAWINAAFRVRVDEAKGSIESIIMAFGGVMAHDVPGSHAVRAKATEQLLQGRQINNDTLQAALQSVSKEVKPVASTSHDRLEFRRRLIVSFVFKLFTQLSGAPDPRAKSASTGLPAEVSTAQQSFNFSEQHAPVSQAIPKISARLQAAGEAQYTDDMPEVKGTVYAAYLLSTKARAKLAGVDVSQVAAAEGVVGVVTATDIPGNNNISALGAQQCLFVPVGGQVEHHAQPVGVVLATSNRLAEEAAKLVQIQYSDVQKPVVTVEDGLKEEKVFLTPMVKEIKNGDAATASLTSAPSAISGRVDMGSQKHFYMEPQTAYAMPGEDGRVKVFCAMQWPDAVQSAVASVLGVPLNGIDIKNRRAGGGFGGKLTHAIPQAAAVALATHKYQLPVKMALNRNVDMRLYGGREEVLANYEVGHQKDGKISALKVDAYTNTGFNVELSFFKTSATCTSLNQVYDLANTHIKATCIKANIAPRSATRGPGEIEGSYIMESIIEQIAHKLDKDPLLVREANFYRDDAKEEELVTPDGSPLGHFTLPKLWNALKSKSNYVRRRAAVIDYNRRNRWKKKGISMTPVRYGVNVYQRTVDINVYGDGTIVVHHDASEMGQGLNTKVAQVVAQGLGKIVGDGQCLDMTRIRFADTSTEVMPNATFTGGSTGSEGCCMAAARACEALGKELEAVTALMRSEAEGKGSDAGDITWEAIVARAKGSNYNLQAQGRWSGQREDSNPYSIYGAAVSEVMVDVLTGEVRVLDVHMLYDSGKSLNPAIDIGQCEGGFMMGLGYYLREQEIYNEQAELITDGTWLYKPPCTADVPLRMQVELLQDETFDRGFLSSKASGEPPLVLSTSVMMAVRMAVQSARADAGVSEWVALPVPSPSDVIAAACASNTQQFKL